MNYTVLTRDGLTGFQVYFLSAPTAQDATNAILDLGVMELNILAVLDGHIEPAYTTITGTPVITYL